MKPLKNTRRLAALVAVPALLFTAACGSDSDSADSSGDLAKVSGAFGEKPEIAVPKGAKPSTKTVTKTLVDGKGPVVHKGDFIRMDFAVQSLKDGKDLGGTWSNPAGAAPKTTARQQIVAQIGSQSQVLPAKVLEGAVGHKAGSRVMIQGTAKDLVGAALDPQAELKAEDSMVWVLDLIGGAKIDLQDEVKGTLATPAAGMPEVKFTPHKAATITIPKGTKAPGELKDQVLIKGSGPKVKAGQGLIGQYTGVGWEDGKKFDSSWDHGGATAFQIGTGSVVQGWDKALVGKNVGDRVLLVVPPKLGYGADPSNPLAKKTLVFTVDIIGTV